MALVEDEERNPFVIEYTKGEEMFTVFKHFGAKPIPAKPVTVIETAEVVLEEDEVIIQEEDDEVIIEDEELSLLYPEIIDLDIDLPQIS